MVDIAKHFFSNNESVRTYNRIGWFQNEIIEIVKDGFIYGREKETCGLWNWYTDFIIKDSPKILFKKLVHDTDWCIGSLKYEIENDLKNFNYVLKNYPHLNNLNKLIIRRLNHRSKESAKYLAK
jgi:hypothetical protein